MPYVAKSAISAKVGDQRVSFARGSRIAHDLGEELRKTHAHALVRIPHSSVNCEKTCNHHSHPWYQPPEAAPIPAKAPAKTVSTPTMEAAK